MNRKNRIAIPLLLFIVTSAAFCAPGAAQEIRVGQARHVISLDHTDQGIPRLVAVDEITFESDSSTKVSICTTLTEGYAFKSLVIRIETNSGISASGEIAWKFPSFGNVPLFGKGVSKPAPEGKTEATFTFLSDLDALSETIRASSGSGAVLRVFTKSDTYKEIEIPAEYFALLTPPGK
ncbi:MAG: hypothetical protein WAZ99_09850 [Rectinemataceae bacterium]